VIEKFDMTLTCGMYEMVGN